MPIIPSSHGKITIINPSLISQNMHLKLDQSLSINLIKDKEVASKKVKPNLEKDKHKFPAIQKVRRSDEQPLRVNKDKLIVEV